MQKTLNSPFFGFVSHSEKPESNRKFTFKMELMHLRKFSEKIFGDKLFKKTRKRPYPEQRFMVFALAHAEDNWSLSNIGQELGGFNHATVLNGLRKCADYYQFNKDFRVSFLSFKNEWERYKVQNSLIKKSNKRRSKFVK